MPPVHAPCLREIGRRLFISVQTVKTDTVSIYRTLGVSSRSEAVERAHALGLIAEARLARSRGLHSLWMRRHPPFRRWLGEPRTCEVPEGGGRDDAPAIALALGYDVEAAFEQLD